MNTLRISLVLAILSLFALPLFAQTTDTPVETPAEPDEVTVVVTAERREQPISESISTTTGKARRRRRKV